MVWASSTNELEPFPRAVVHEDAREVRVDVVDRGLDLDDRRSGHVQATVRTF